MHTRQRRPLLRMLNVVIVIVASAAFLPGIACAQPAAKSASVPTTIKTGAAVAITGPGAPLGVDMKVGYEIAVEHINAGGGIFVKQYNRRIPLELILLDDESDPTKTASRLETLNTQHHVVAYLGSAGSVFHAAAASVAEKNRIAYLGTAMGLISPHKLGYRYLFSPFSKANQTPVTGYEALNYYVPEGKRPTKVAIFTLNNEEGEEATEAWKEAAPRFGYQVVFERKYAVGTKDFSSLIMSAKAAGAETLLSYPTPGDGFTLMRQIKELKWNLKFITFIRAAAIIAWGQVLGADGDYVCAYTVVSHKAPYAGMKELEDTYYKKFGKHVSGLVSAAYASVQILANSIERAGTLDREKIRDAIAATDMMTAIGPMKFRPDGTPIMHHAVNQWQKGQLQQIWPREVADAPLIYPIPPWDQR